MTTKELELLEIAKEIIDLNEADLDAKLTGSLMLALRGMPKRREAHDIDILCEYLCLNDDRPKVPKGFRLVETEGEANSDLLAMHYVNNEGVKIDFLHGDESFIEVIYGVRCASVEGLYKAKKRYAEKDKREESKEKHTEDLKYLEVEL